MHLYLIRHGQTFHNLNRIVQWHYDGKLTPDWIAGAQRTGDALASVAFDAIYASDLSRAYDTAQCIAGKQWREVVVEQTELLRERSFGKYDNVAKKDIEELLWIQWNEDKIYTYIQQDVWAESDEQAHERAKKIIELFIAKHQGETVCVVSHGSFLWMMLYVICWWASNVDFNIKNTSISLCSYDGEQWRTIGYLNDTAHLS